MSERGVIIDMRSGERICGAIHPPERVSDETRSDEERIEALTINCISMIERASRMIWGAKGLDAALTALGSIADRLRNER